MSDKKISKIKIGIINLKTNNLYSIYNAIKNIGYNVSIIETNTKYLNYDFLILPGVGSYAKGMKNITENNFNKRLIDFILPGEKKILGICLGMQLLFENSNEFKMTKGLGLIKGKDKKFKFIQKTILPHIGWNSVVLNNKMNYLKSSLINKKFYFVHSYVCEPADINYCGTKTFYGNKYFCSSIIQKNIIGTQFHPEKSGKAGINLLKSLLK